MGFPEIFFGHLRSAKIRTPYRVQLLLQLVVVGIRW
jgi:hypothetical protein